MKDFKFKNRIEAIFGPLRMYRECSRKVTDKILRDGKWVEFQVDTKESEVNFDQLTRLSKLLGTKDIRASGYSIDRGYIIKNGEAKELESGLDIVYIVAYGVNFK